MAHSRTTTQDITETVVASFSHCNSPRLRQIMEELVKHVAALEDDFVDRRSLGLLKRVHGKPPVRIPSRQVSWLTPLRSARLPALRQWLFELRSALTVPGCAPDSHRLPYSPLLAGSGTWTFFFCRPNRTSQSRTSLDNLGCAGRSISAC